MVRYSGGVQLLLGGSTTVVSMVQHVYSYFIFELSIVRCLNDLTL